MILINIDKKNKTTLVECDKCKSNQLHSIRYDGENLHFECMTCKEKEQPIDFT